MRLFGPPDVDKMKAKRDVKGLIETLGYRKDDRVRSTAARALGQIDLHHAGRVASIRDGPTRPSYLGGGGKRRDCHYRVTRLKDCRCECNRQTTVTPN